MADDLAERLVAAGNDGLTGLPLLMPVVEAANELERLRAEVARYKVLYIDCHNALDETKRELAALRERIEKAPVFDVHEEPLFGYPGRLVVKTHSLPEDFRGKRVRLLVEEE